MRRLHPIRSKAVNESKASKRLGGWPLWIRLASFSIVFYLLLVIWFLRTLERERDLHPIAAPMILQSKPSISIESFVEAVTQEPLITDKTSAEAMDGKKKLPKLLDKSKEADDGTLFYGFHRESSEAYLKEHGPRDLRQIIGAFLEPETSFVIPGTVNQGVIEDEHDQGVPPQFVMPLPLRTYTPDDLKHFQYPKFQTCHDLPAKLPVDRGMELDSNGNPVVWNVGNEETPANYAWDEAPYCPVDADPFLPWIHDLFPRTDGSVLEFIAHNRRRCKTGQKHRPDVLRLEPQVALMQHVSVERLTSKRATQLAPELWNDDSGPSINTPRYRLAPMNESSTDGRFTRFICRFHGTVVQGKGKPKSIVIQETLSIYPFNYEFVSYRKNKPTMITPKGKDNQFFWTSILRFQCPVPDSLRDIVKAGGTVLSDGTPTLHVDLIPIRTPPRFGIEEMYLTEDMIGPRDVWKKGDWRNLNNSSGHDSTPGFNPYARWGARHVLPRVEASGRWTNLPICRVPALPKDDPDQAKEKKILSFEAEKEKGTKKPHLLSACVWASASFKTRGQGQSPILDASSRLIEWIEFHLMVGFDHIYVFDNSGAQTNKTSLKPILDQYPKSQISRIEWPSIVCNNNIPAHDSTGERSSQYTAENACRTRFGSFTEWIAAFDIDEYMIPAGNHESLRDVLREASKKKETNILTFRSTRARLLYERSLDKDGGDYREMMPNVTFMQAYNCDSSPIPKPDWADRARKQIYRADYVPYHFVHYSTVTQGLLEEYKNNPRSWKRIFKDEGTERITDEANEAILLHTKTTSRLQTSRWNSRCHYKFKKKWRGCYVGFAWPNGRVDLQHNYREEDGMEYNCFLNDRIENYWVPKLRSALQRRMNVLSTN